MLARQAKKNKMRQANKGSKKKPKKKAVTGAAAAAVFKVCFFAYKKTHLQLKPSFAYPIIFT